MIILPQCGGRESESKILVSGSCFAVKRCQHYIEFRMIEFYIFPRVFYHRNTDISYRRPR